MEEFRMIETMKIRNQSFVNYCWTMVKEKPIHSHTGKIRFHIPNTKYTTNYLPYYSKRVCKIIDLVKHILRKLPLETQEDNPMTGNSAEN